MADVTSAVMSHELVAAGAWAARRGWQLTYDEARRIGNVHTVHPALEGQAVNFWFDVTGYPDRQPPAWWCGPDGTTITRDAADYPKPPATPMPGLSGSIFHNQPVICAPWNRLAYSINGGPHQDWPDLAAWKTTGIGYTQAHTIADMLSQLQVHLSASDGMQDS
jgi:hypothetical protein